VNLISSLYLKCQQTDEGGRLVKRYNFPGRGNYCYYTLFLLYRLACTVSTACLDQLLIAIRSVIMLRDHIRSKTRLIVIMNRIATATLQIIYASLHNGRLS